MKAIRKSDGKIIDVEVHGWRGERAISYHTNFKQFYKPEELDFNVPKESEQSEQSSSFDWQSFRAEAAKDILCATLSGGIASGATGLMEEKGNIVKASIEITDELIKQLKERD